jgi:transcriptional regulator PpsR
MASSEQSRLFESLLLGLSDLILYIQPKTFKVKSLKTKGVELSRLKLEGWVGKKMSELSEIDSDQKILSVLNNPIDLKKCSSEELQSDWRHINFLSPEQQAAPFSVKFFKLNDDDLLVMCARDLGSMSKIQQKLMETHRSMERDYLRLRHMETRCNLLFESSSEPILIVDLMQRKILQSNTAAVKLLSASQQKKLVGTDLFQHFTSDYQDALESWIGAVQTGGKTKPLRVKSNYSSVELTLTPTVMMQEGGPQLLIRLGMKSPNQATIFDTPIQEWYTDALQKAPYGFVVTDANGMVLSANEEFLTLSGSFAQTQVVGKPFETWLARGAVDWGVLINNLKQNSSLRNFATELVNQTVSPVDVEISAVTLDTEQKRYAFFIQDVQRLSESSSVASSTMAGSVSQLAQLVGRMPMKDIVGETSNMIEKMCIQSALELTQNNRASTAEMLGLSRQSLYIKLHRYGIADVGEKV